MASTEKTNMNKTLQNAKQYFIKSRHKYVAELLPPNKGLIAVKESTRTYCIFINMYMDLNIMCMGVYPGLCVSVPYYEMTLDYLSKINNSKRIDCINIKRDGNIYASTYQSYRDCEISMDTFFQLENRLILSIESELENLERVSAGKLPLEKPEDLLLKSMLGGFDNLMKNHNPNNLTEEDEDVSFVEEDQGDLEKSPESAPISMEEFLRQLTEEDSDRNE